MTDETERLIVRAAQMFSYGASTDEVIENFVDEGVSPETAYLVAKAGRVFERGRAKNPASSSYQWSRFAWVPV